MECQIVVLNEPICDSTKQLIVGLLILHAGIVCEVISIRKALDLIAIWLIRGDFGIYLGCIGEIVVCVSH